MNEAVQPMLAPVAWYQVLAAVMFSIGAMGVLFRRNVLVIFMCVELMLNAANIAFVSFARHLGSLDGQIIVFFVLAVAAAGWPSSSMSSASGAPSTWRPRTS